MTFPESPRVVYERNPLAFVVCQLRFPPILRIESELPTTFQEGIRGQYPLFRERRNPAIPLPSEVTKAFGDQIAGMLGNAGNRHYDFASADDVWKVSLTRDFLALTTRKYQMWQDFKARLIRLEEALRTQYEPAFYTRLGLRYRDVIRKKDWGFEEVPWSDLLKPHIAGELSSTDIANSIERVANDVTIRLEFGRVRIRHGLLQQGDTTDPNVYVFDADFFLEDRTETAHALDRLDYFNREAGRLFRWAISEQLHNAMAPRAV